MSSAKAKKPEETSSAPPVHVVKRSPYPFDVHIFKQEGSAGVKGLVQKMTLMGFLVKIPSISYLSVNGNFFAKFELPGSGALLQEEVKVIKTYQEIADNMFIAEVHFRHLSGPGREKIQEFTSKSKQKD